MRTARVMLVLVLACGCGRVSFQTSGDAGHQDVAADGEGGRDGDTGDGDPRDVNTPADGGGDAPADAPAPDSGDADTGTPSDAGCTGAPLVWRRSADWVDGTTLGSSEGNPAPDFADRPTWYYEVVSGGPLGSADIWYANTPTLAVWDDDWYGGGELAWAYGDDSNPPMFRTYFIHNATSSYWDRIPRVRWQNPLDVSVRMSVSGRFDFDWTGVSVAVAEDVDVVIAVLDTSGAAFRELLATTVVKPTPDTTRESIGVDVPALEALVAPGESIVVSLRVRGSTGDASWVDIHDDLTFLGSPCP